MLESGAFFSRKGGRSSGFRRDGSGQMVPFVLCFNASKNVVFYATVAVNISLVKRGKKHENTEL